MQTNIGPYEIFKQFLCRADHNLLTEIPYDFSLQLQKYDKNVIHLGDNPWTCVCNSEITNMVTKEIDGSILPFLLLLCRT